MDEGFEAWLRLPGPDIMPGTKEWYASWSAWQASRRAAMEKACAAVCEMCRKGIVVSDKHACSPIRRAFAERDAVAIRKMAEEGGGDAE